MVICGCSSSGRGRDGGEERVAAEEKSRATTREGEDGGEKEATGSAKETLRFGPCLELRFVTEIAVCGENDVYVDESAVALSDDEWS